MYIAVGSGVDGGGGLAGIVWIGGLLRIVETVVMSALMMSFHLLVGLLLLVDLVLFHPVLAALL